MTGSKKDEIGFEAAFKELETIVERLESGESTLDEAMKDFEKGMELVKLCSGKLNEAESRLQKLLKNDSGEYHLNEAE